VTDVEFFVDPSCPWAWVTSRWVAAVAPARDLTVQWRSYCLEIRDDYDVAPTVPPDFRQRALDAHTISHRMLRIFEAARAEAGEPAVDALYTAWGRSFFSGPKDPDLLATCIATAGLDPGLLDAADDETLDVPIRAAMEVAYAFCGPKTQTPAIIVRSDPPRGFKGPVMATAPTGPAALELWDAVQVLSEHDGFFEISRPRVEVPHISVS
jgi:hypothetical protein